MLNMAIDLKVFIRNEYNLKKSSQFPFITKKKHRLHPS